MSMGRSNTADGLSAIALAEIAAQLACPSGDVGIKAGRNMAINNANMTNETFMALELNQVHKLLEIGFGNGEHVAPWLARYPHLHYSGVEKSMVMLEEAKAYHAEAIKAGRVQLMAASETGLPFENEVFQAIVTINTLYFWPDVATYLRSLTTALAPGGALVMTIADKSFMQSLPFTSYGFKLYELAEVQQYLAEAGLIDVFINTHTEQVMSNANTEVERLYYVIKAQKPL